MRYSGSGRTRRTISNPPLHESYTPLRDGADTASRGWHHGIRHTSPHPSRPASWACPGLDAGASADRAVGGGVMEAVSRAFFGVAARSGLVIGILPAADASWGQADADPGTPYEYPNPWVELAIRTHLDVRMGDGTGVRSRNHLNILTSDVVVALPGSAGTASEVELAIRYGRRLVLLGDTDRAERLPVTVPTAESVQEALEFVRRNLRLASLRATG